MERFEVYHEPMVEPHGWMYTNDHGLVDATLAIQDRVKIVEQNSECSFAVVEMGVPEWLELMSITNQVLLVAEKCPNTQLIPTHTYIDSEYKILTKKSQTFLKM